MGNISAPKVVLIMFSLTACIGFLIGKTSDTTFATFVTIVISYYFGTKQGARTEANAQALGLTTVNEQDG